MRVLLIDDDQVLARCIARRLRGLDVTTENDPEAALGRLRAGEHFDLVICDQRMPAILGTEVLREARLRLGPDAVLCLMSGDDEIAKIATSDAVLLLKPFSRDDLESVVAIAREAARRQPFRVTRPISRMPPLLAAAS